MPKREEGGTSNRVEGNSDKGLPTLDNSYKPEVTITTGGSVMKIVVTILSTLTVVGVVVIVVSIALIGFNSILGSANGKAQGQEKYIGLFIAALVITGASILAKMIITVAESLWKNKFVGKLAIYRKIWYNDIHKGNFGHRRWGNETSNKINFSNNYNCIVNT